VQIWDVASPWGGRGGGGGTGGTQRYLGYSGTLEGTRWYSDHTELVDDRREDEHHSDDHNHLQ
jgi:hypothetical protein